MPYTLHDSAGNIEAGWFDQLWVPKQIRGASKCGVVLLHGASTTANTTGSEWTLSGWPELCKLAAVLAENGIPAVAGHMGGNNFSNDATCGTGPTAYINKALTYMAAQTGCSSAKAHLFGVSMGGGNAARYAGLNPAKAASAVGLIPNVSIEHAYTDNPNNYAGQALPGFAEMVAPAWGLTSRVVSDAVLNGTTTLTSATAAFTGADVGRQLVDDNLTGGQGGIPNDTTVVSVTNGTTIVMDKSATLSGSARKLFIGDPLPMSGDGGADLIGHFAPILDTNNIPNRWYYASDDPYIYPADVMAFAAASGGTAINLGAGGHTNLTAQHASAHNGGSDWSDYVAFIMANGA